MELPPDFVKTVSATFPGGAEWLPDLPVLLHDCARRYDLTLSPTPFELSFNYVAPAVRNADKQEIVLKVGVPSNSEIVTEIAALRQWNRNGAVRLLHADEERGVLLLERLRPGTMLSSLWPDRDDEATEIAGVVMRGLWPLAQEQTRTDYPAPYSPPFLSVADWARALDEAGAANNAPPALLPLVVDARSVFAELIADTRPEAVILLHGDLHHFNLLQAGTSWQAIDPKGVWGDRAYEAGALLRNPWPGLLDHADPQAITNCRLDILAGVLDIDRERLRLWAWAGAVLSAGWSVDAAAPDGGDGWQHSAACTHLLSGAAKKP